MKTEKQHLKVVSELRKSLTEEYANKHKSLSEEVSSLKEDLKQAKDLSKILDKFSSLTIDGKGFASVSGSWNTEIRLPDSVLQYVDDILGGNVIKQEGNKCIVIDENGIVKTGLTKQDKDKGFNYKLVREPIGF